MEWDRTNPPVWFRFAVGVSLPFAAAAIRLQFLDVPEFPSAFLTFYPAVTVAALYGGIGSGLIATFISAALANYFWMPPLGSLGISGSPELISMVIFVSSGTLISFFAEAALRGRVREKKAEEEARIAAEREKSAIALSQSESKYRELVQNANSAIIRWKRDGTIAFFNEYAQQLFGYSSEEVIGKNINLLVPGRDSTGGDLTSLVQDIVNHPDRYANNINENILRNGDRVWMAWTNRPIFDEDGRVREILAIGSDITERKLSEEKIRAQNALLETINLIFHNALTCETEAQFGSICLKAAEDLTGSRFGFIGELDSDGLLREIAISDPGWEACRMSDQSGHGLRKPQVGFKMHGLYGRVLLDGRSLVTNSPELHPDSIGTPTGHPLLHSFLGVPLEHQGQLIGMVGLANREGGYNREQVFAMEALAPAIVESLMRKRAELTLGRSESRFRLLSETSRGLLASQNPQAIVEDLCLEVMRHLDCHAFFNFLVDEPSGKLHLNACAGIPEEDARAIEWLDYGVAVCGCVALSAERIVAEDIFHTPDARTDLVKSYGIQAYACHPLMVQGRLIGTLSFGTKSRARFAPDEISLMKTVADQVAVAMDRINLIEELRRSRDELELRVQERTAELKTYMAKLEESNQALQDFASIASHDLQEPLRKVISFGNILKRKHSAALGEGNDYLDRLLTATERMHTLLKDLLEYSRVSARSEPFKDVALSELVSEVLSDLEVRIAKTGGKVEVGDLPVVQADPTQMRQLFQNLIGNALKFHKEGEMPVVKVFCTLGPGPAECRIFVEDNGIGFEEQFLDRIFAPFQRLHGRSSRYEGTGMGLAICRKIVERHGGSISAKSAPGSGAMFIVTLPV